MLYCIALVNRRRDLLNLDCPFLPEGWATADYDPNDLPSILPQLCSKYNGKANYIIMQILIGGYLKDIFRLRVLNLAKLVICLISLKIGNIQIFNIFE